MTTYTWPKSIDQLHRDHLLPVTRKICGLAEFEASASAIANHDAQTLALIRQMDHSGSDLGRTLTLFAGEANEFTSLEEMVNPDAH